MIESFKQLEELSRDRDIAEVFLESDEQEHAVPAEMILEALRKRRAVMRDCVERGKSGGESMGKLVGNEARLLQELKARLDAMDAPQHGRTELSALLEQAERAGARHIVTAHAPTGPVASTLSALARLAESRGMRVRQILRDHDRRAWPHATHGFFRFREAVMG